MPQSDTKKKPLGPASIASQLLADSLFEPPKRKGSSAKKDDDQAAKDPLSSQVWRMYTKAKDNLPNGSRLENLTWRMMAMTLKNRTAAKSKSCDEDRMMIDQEETKLNSAEAINSNKEEQPNAPPSPDDTVALLSSSAPPYMMNFLDENPDLASENKNVMISGSSQVETSHPQKVQLLLFSIIILSKILNLFSSITHIAFQATCRAVASIVFCQQYHDTFV